VRAARPRGARGQGGVLRGAPTRQAVETEPVACRAALRRALFCRCFHDSVRPPWRQLLSPQRYRSAVVEHALERLGFVICSCSKAGLTAPHLLNCQWHSRRTWCIYSAPAFWEHRVLVVGVRVPLGGCGVG
jgi:hypothetical protein